MPAMLIVLNHASLSRRAGATVDHEVVVEDLQLLVVGQVVEVQVVNREVAFDVLADTDRALLAIDDLEVAVVADRPIHHVQREVLADGVDDRSALLLPVDELTLIRRADVEPAAVADDASLLVVLVALGELPNTDSRGVRYSCWIFTLDDDALVERLLGDHRAVPHDDLSLGLGLGLDGSQCFAVLPALKLPTISNWSGLYLSRKLIGTPINPS